MVASGGCDVGFNGKWASDGRDYLLETHTIGPSCANAVVVLVVRDTSQAPVYVWSARTRDIFGLRDAADSDRHDDGAEGLGGPGNGALSDNRNVAGLAQGRRYADEWRVPLLSRRGLKPGGYLDIRRSARSILCFPQGLESSLCLCLQDGGFEPLGLQTFPG